MAWPSRVVLGLVLLLFALLALRQVSSPDVGFHLAAGNHILTGNGWPTTDPFTYTVRDHTYLDTSWGYQVLLALVERVAGAPGMVLLHVALVLTMFSLVIRTARLVPGESRVLLPLLVLGGLAAEPRFAVRPEILSYTLLALVLLILQRHVEGLGSRLRLLPLIFLVWVNSHGLFVLGWVVLACFVVGTALRHKRIDLPLVGWSAASIVAGLINPYGWRALAFPLTLATRMNEANVFARNIGEFSSPLDYLRSDQLMFYLVPVACFFILAALTALSVFSLWRQKRFAGVLLCLAFLPLALIMVRNVPALAVACLPGAVWGLSLDRVLDTFGLRGVARRGMRHAFLGLVLLVVAGLGLRVATDAYYVSSRRMERFGLGWNSLALPVDATAYAKQAALPGRVLNHLNFGAYLIWELDQPVFIDGRLEVMGETFFEEYRRALGSPAGLQETVQRYGVGWVVFPYRLRPDLLDGMSRHPGWRLVYVDHLAVIFVRRDTGQATMEHESARLAEQPAPALADLPGLGGPKRSSGAARWVAGLVRRQSFPYHAVGLGVFHFQRAAPQRATAEFARAIRQSDGAYYEIYNNLGAALFAAGNLAPARDCYRIYLRELPFYRREPRRQAREQLAEIDGALGGP
jgi:tetratricopeptide (TPR) repeat protein